MTKHAVRLELDKILSAAAAYAELDGSRAAILCLEPSAELAEANRRLDLTAEAHLLLYELGAGGILGFSPVGDSLERAEKGSILGNAELLNVARLLCSARACYHSVHAYSDPRIDKMKTLTDRLVFDENLERDIGKKIPNENEIADTASEKLFSIRREINSLGERIRARLGAYLTGGERKYLQDSLVTVRGDRYVIPVKAEYKRNIRGFVHDRSASGATVFIEPEEVLEMNNELTDLILDEREEIERILKELSREVGNMRDRLETDVSVLAEVDLYYALAQYGYRHNCVRPKLNNRGVIEIHRGRHPLLDREKAVPVSVSLGEDYDFLLISGANTGGKTVTLKMCGLFSLMAACGLFVPAGEGTRLGVFRGIYCDLGDSQSIEENLSTFSSHIVNLREILEGAGQNTLVLIDEPGGGTDPEEGQALARAVLSSLAKKGCRGIVTTHYSALKEFAYEQKRMQNGCMEFDAEDFRPLYRLKIGAPGSSNALAICTRLGLPGETVEEARGYLSEGARSFERTLRAAEESRIQAEAEREKAENLKNEWTARLRTLEKEEEKFKKEREKFLYSSKAEARRIVSERTARAEELLSEIEEIFKKETLTESDIIKARTLKNKMAENPEEKEDVRLLPIDKEKLKVGDTVFVGAMSAQGVVLSLKKEKNAAEVQVGNLRVASKIGDLFYPSVRKEEKRGVQVVRNLAARADLPRECNLLGFTAGDAAIEVENFLDAALVANLTEVRIVHGMGTGKVRAAVHEVLRKHPHVESFRLGKYGEGESGVTIVKLR